MNPAMVTRVMRSSTNSPLVNSLHMSVINLGILVGSWVGGLTIEYGYGWNAPLWSGMIMAFIGLLSILPFMKKYSNVIAK